MRTALSIVVPGIVIVYLWARCSNSPLAFCSLVVAITLGPAVYLNVWPISIHVPGLPAAMDWQDLTMLLLGGAWACVILAFRHRRPGRLVVGLDTWILLSLVFFLCLQVPMAWGSDGRVALGVPYAMRGWIYLPLSLGMWISILRRVAQVEVERFLDSLAWLMVPLSFLYCLSEVGIATNPYVGWAPFEVGNTVVVRDTLTFPFFTPLALAWFCSRRRQSVWTLGAQGVLLASCVLSYSRTIAAGAVVIVVVVALMRTGTSHAFSKGARRVLAVAAILTISGAGLVLLSPGQVGYALGRFAPSLQSGAKETNTAHRLAWFHDGAAIIGQKDPLFGLGFGREGTSTLLAYASQPGVYLGDFTWAVVIFTFGWLGLAAYGALYAQFVFLSFLNAVRKRVQPFGLAFALVGVAFYDVIRTSATFPWGMYPTASALALALLYVDRRAAWTVVPQCISAGSESLRGGSGADCSPF